MGRAAHDQQVGGLDQLRRSLSDWHAVHIGVRMCLANTFANCLGDFVGVAEHALVHNRDLPHTVNQIYGRQRARLIRRSLAPQCLSSFRKDENFRIIHSQAIIIADAGDFVFYDCAYEELLQALGPVNDTSVPWTMFNDDVDKGFFDVYDQYILNILYHPRVRPGMTREDVRALLPEVMRDVRAFVAKVNRLKQ